MVEPIDMNLDELRAALAPRLPVHAAFDGWGEGAIAMAWTVVDAALTRIRP